MMHMVQAHPPIDVSRPYTEYDSHDQRQQRTSSKTVPVKGDNQFDDCVDGFRVEKVLHDCSLKVQVVEAVSSAQEGAYPGHASHSSGGFSRTASSYCATDCLTFGEAWLQIRTLTGTPTFRPLDL
jgi:hypothetical protein